MTDGQPVGYAYLDTHRVRTLPETLMVVLEPDGGVRRVEVVVFREPIEYIPRDSWYGQFEGERLSDELALKRDIRPVTGATLTARATTEAVRRVLAIHAVMGTGGDR
jgi:Na+-translocating ferredoxin:NAD+ oxidoreductase RnfG subunit